MLITKAEQKLLIPIKDKKMFENIETILLPTTLKTVTENKPIVRRGYLSPPPFQIIPPPFSRNL